MRLTLLSLALSTFASNLCCQDRQAATFTGLNTTTTSPSLPPLHIHVTAPPLLGTTPSITVDAPGYITGMWVLGTGAEAGLSLPYLGTTLDLYIDPLQILAIFPLPLANGSGNLPLPLPPNPTLSGLDLAMQAVVLAPSGQAAASPLLGMNLGDQLTGGAEFAFTFTKSIAANSHAMDQGHPARKLALYCNDTSAARDLTIRGVKQTGKGPLEVRDENGTRLGTQIPESVAAFTRTLSVPAGGCVHLFQAGNSEVDVSWNLALK